MHQVPRGTGAQQGGGWGRAPLLHFGTPCGNLCVCYRLAGRGSVAPRPSCVPGPHNCLPGRPPLLSCVLQYSPSPGMPDQESITGVPGRHCLLCPRGSLALSDPQTAATAVDGQITDGATFCDAW